LQGFGAQAVTLGSKAKSNHRVFRVRAHQGFEGFDGGKGCEKSLFSFLLASITNICQSHIALSPPKTCQNVRMSFHLDK